MEINKLPIYVKIDANVKERAMMYITKSKLTDKEIKTLSGLTEEALEQYMIDNPI